MKFRKAFETYPAPEIMPLHMCVTEPPIGGIYYRCASIKCERQYLLGKWQWLATMELSPLIHGHDMTVLANGEAKTFEIWPRADFSEIFRTWVLVREPEGADAPVLVG